MGDSPGAGKTGVGETPALRDSPTPPDTGSPTAVSLFDRNRRRGQRPQMLRIGGSIGPVQFIALAATTFAVLLTVWWVISAAHLVKPLFLPSPSMVWQAFTGQWRNGQLFADARVSITRILIGFAIATLLAVPLGVLVGIYRLWEATVEPLMDFIRYMPVVAFVPLTILWVGTGNSQKWLIIFIGTFFQQVLLIMDNTKRVPLDFVDVGRTLGMKDRAILGRIIVPAAAPGIWDSIRISLGWAWTWLVLAELVAATTGLGYRINNAQRYFETNLIIAYILVLGVLGLFTDQVMKLIGRRLFSYAEERR